jgi:hypothetical protein
MVDFNPQTFELTYQGGKASGGGSPGMSFAAIHRRPERAVST